MRITVIAVGRARPGPEADLYARYATRLRPPPLLREVRPAARADPADGRRRDGTALLALVPPEARLVALDAAGEILSSEAFAGRLGRWRDEARPVCFAIGGDAGLDRTVLARADPVLSLGRMVWPHLLVRALLAEQLYRADCLLRGHPYHRA